MNLNNSFHFYNDIVAIFNNNTNNLLTLILNCYLKCYYL